MNNADYIYAASLWGLYIKGCNLIIIMRKVNTNAVIKTS